MHFPKDIYFNHDFHINIIHKVVEVRYKFDDFMERIDTLLARHELSKWATNLWATMTVNALPPTQYQLLWIDNWSWYNAFYGHQVSSHFIYSDQGNTMELCSWFLNIGQYFVHWEFQNFSSTTKPAFIWTFMKLLFNLLHLDHFKFPWHNAVAKPARHFGHAMLIFLCL